MQSPNSELKGQLDLPVLIATASILQISETLIPHPIPGLRFGFANIISLIILFRYGFKPALIVTVLRTIVSSFILGSFLSPGFILSFVAGLASICITGALNRFSNMSPILRISPVGLGMAGAFVHNLVQIILAYVLLIRLPQIFYLVPWLSLGALALGGFSGWLTSCIINELALDKNVEKIPIDQDQAFELKIFFPGVSVVHRLKVEFKLLIMLAITVLVVVVQNLTLYSIIFVVVLLLIALAHLSYIKTIKMVKKLWVIFLSAFFIPLFFNPGSDVLIESSFFVLHKEAIIMGLIFSSRIILLALLTAILAQTTKTKELASGIKTLIQPLEKVGIDSDHMAHLIFESLVRLPQSWYEIRSVIKHVIKGEKTSLRKMKDGVIQIFVYILSARNNKL